MKLGQKLLLLYCAFLSIFIAFGSVTFAIESGNFFTAILFLPVIAHFVLVIFTPHRQLRLLLAYNFILTTIMAVTGFVGARSEPQIISAAFFTPLAIYFWQFVIPKKGHQIPVNNLGFEILQVVPARAPRLKKIPQEEKPGRHFDVDRRMFLKLIGSAGMTLFLFSVFTKKAEASFFGSVPGPGTVALKDTTGTLVDPAIKQPTDGYKISEIDDSSPAYYGFIEKTGKWFIMKEDSSGAYRYTKGDSSFSTNWTSRASLTYDYFDAIF
ncbi:hypothetical protein HY440_00085 [Candidatus Microgenomates bacterium]|nr:hypothetical protein [Candidatus Microgenomates bacterium]